LGVVRPSLVLAALLLIALHAVAAAPKPLLEVRALAVHLFLTPSGEFSSDVSAMPGFSSWNFTPTVQVGPDDQRFNSFLIKVRLGGAAESFHKGPIGSISVASRQTKKVLFSSPIRGLYIGPTGEAVVARLVDGHVCEPITVVATVGASRISRDIEFLCAE
jgi:hypothetical protein